MRLLPVFLLILTGCPGPDDSSSKADVDGDGFTTDEGDCDDLDEVVFPTAVEVWYDGVDQNCDGNDDDQDLDGVGFSVGDCDDTDADVLPGAEERCDGVDNDCDGTVDQDAVDAVDGYTDDDGDGFGNPDSHIEGCVLPDSAVVDNHDDCDDRDAAINPDAEEVCDGADNDCNGEVDEGAAGTSTFYADVDGDGFGDPASTLTDCSAPEGYIDNDADCDDTNGAINPAAVETCSDVDENCDGDATAGAVDLGTWFTDADDDSFGDDATLVESCVQPEGTVSVGGDCDDTHAAASPAGSETCDGLDNDCNGTVDDDAADATPWYTDNDGDGFGSDEYVLACDAPIGTIGQAGDCDDAAADVNPAATEACDGVDNDCNGAIDDGGSGGGIAYVDADGDGYGDPATAEDWACEAPAGSVDNGEDCDDFDGAVNPGATETCNGVDDDCDGDTDGATAVDASTWYADDDGDGYGDASAPVLACDAPIGTVSDTSDCDDADGAVNPAAVEACNGFDDDCDAATDEAGAVGEVTWYADVDGDGYGDDATALLACDAPVDTVDMGGDCDDADDTLNPGATEICDGVDQNCSGDVDDEAGTASWEDTTGAFTDVTTLLASGSAVDPILVGDQSTYDLIVSTGTVHLCAGDWYAKIVTATAGSTLTVQGAGADLTSVSSGGVAVGTPGSVVVAANSTMVIEDLTITGGIGSSSSKGGAIIASQTTGTTNPTSPNLTLRGVVVSGNATQYGGGIAINSYGWVDLQDTLVAENSASIAGGGLWLQGAGKVTCAATSLGAAGIIGNTSPVGGGLYFSSSSTGTLTSTGCDWGADATGDDNATYDVQVSSTTNRYCYPNVSSLTTVYSCTGGVCTASTDTTCP